MSETTSKFPGWYLEFQTDVLSQLPRPGQIDQTTARGWHSNRRGLREELLGVLVSKTFSLLAEVGIVEVVDKRYQVTVWGHVREGQISKSEERLNFLKQRGAVLLGRIGLDALQSQNLFCKLSRNRYYLSFLDSSRRDVPLVSVSSKGEFRFHTGSYMSPWFDGHDFLCFCELK